MSEQPAEIVTPACGCPRLRGEDVECICGVDCAVCWPWAHEDDASQPDGGVS